MDVGEFDTQNAFDSVTNFRFQPTIAGYYQINSQVTWNAAVRGSYVTLYKNGTEFKRGRGQNINYALRLNVTALIYFNGSTDYAELFAYQAEGSTQGIAAVNVWTYFTTALVGIGAVGVTGGGSGTAAVVFGANHTSSITVPTGVRTLIPFTTVEYDSNNYYDIATSRFTPLIAGYYQVTAGVGWVNPVVAAAVGIDKNTAEYKRGMQTAAGATMLTSSVTAIVPMNGTTDYLTVKAFQNSGNNETTLADTIKSFFQAHLIK